MSRHANCQDVPPGMNRPITRRDLLNTTLLASGSLLLESPAPKALLAQTGDWDGYGGVGDYSKSNGNSLAVLEAGHQIRDGRFDSLPSNLAGTEEVYDCVVVGGGISGLAAALFFQRHAGEGK